MKLSFIQKWYIKKAQIKLERLLKFYDKKETVLDIGSGNGGFCLLLKQNEINITALDVKDKSGFEEIKPIVYDGEKLPFEDNAFDVVQLITVLHHIPDPIKIVKEAKRVGKKVIIMEDIYESYFQKIITWVADSINNWEFIGHPHTNKDDKGWKAVFKDLNLEIEHVEYYNFLLFFKQVTYILKK